jgi:protoporphyrin/coproporphyrin ferrochelatase
LNRTQLFININSLAMMKRIAVILVAHGEAETDSFFENFSMIRHTLAHAGEVMKLPRPLQLVASLAGGLKNKVTFRAQKYLSPQNRITRQQASLLQEKLNRVMIPRLTNIEVYSAFHATPPFVKNIVEQTSGHDLQLLISMSPIDNRLTSGNLQQLSARYSHVNGQRSPVVVHGFWKDAGLRQVCLDHLFCHGKTGERSALVLTFHGTLVKDTKGGIPRFHTGLKEMQEMGSSLRDAILIDPRNSYDYIEIAYLNHDVGGTWTKPSLAEALNALSSKGIRDVDIFSCGYFSDGTETILHAQKEAAASSVKTIRILPCINDSEAFADFLAEKVAAVVAAESP